MNHSSLEQELLGEHTWVIEKNNGECHGDKSDFEMK
jgi:hypothetical protein